MHPIEQALHREAGLRELALGVLGGFGANRVGLFASRVQQRLGFAEVTFVVVALGELRALQRIHGDGDLVEVAQDIAAIETVDGLRERHADDRLTRQLHVMPPASRRRARQSPARRC